MEITLVQGMTLLGDVLGFAFVKKEYTIIYLLMLVGLIAFIFRWG